MTFLNRYMSLFKFFTQGGVILCLTIALILPYVRAQETPTALPTITSTPTIPATPSSEDLLRAAREREREAETALNNQQREILDRNGENVPDTLREAMSGGARQSTQDANRQDAYNDLENSLADTGITSADPVSLSQGDMGSLVDSGVTDPSTLAALSGNIQRTFNSSYDQSLLASMHATWVSGVQGGGNCSTGDDDGKDVCQELTDLNDLLSDMNDDVSNLLARARRLRTYLSIKPAFLNTAPSRIPVCLGLLTPGVGETLDTVNIAQTTEDYDVNEGMMSMGAVRNNFVAAGDLTTGSGSVSGGDPLSVGTSFSNASSTVYRQNITAIQSSFDRIMLLGWQNFDNAVQTRFDVLKSHSNEIKTLLDQLARVQRSLNQRSRTP